MGVTRPASPGNPLSARWGYLKRVVSHCLSATSYGCLRVVFFFFLSRQQAYPLCRNLLAIVVVPLRAQHVIFLCSQVLNAKRSQLLLRTLCRHLSWRLTTQLIERPNSSNFLRDRRETFFECFFLFEGFLWDCSFLASQKNCEKYQKIGWKFENCKNLPTKIC